MPQYTSRWRLAIVIAMVGVAVGAIGCSDISSSINPKQDPDQILWRLETNPHALVMAVDEVQRLDVRALSILGTPISIPVDTPIQFTSSDSLQVAVDAQGNLTARAPTAFDPWTGHQPVQITIRWKYGAITKIDTAFVVVTQEAPTVPITSLSIAPPPYPADSVWRSRQQVMTIPVTAEDSLGAEFPNAFAYLFTDLRRRQLYDFVGPVSRDLFFSTIPGKFWVYASVRMYGRDLQDSVQYLTTDAGFTSVNLTGDALGNVAQQGGVGLTAYLAPCALVFFSNQMPVVAKFTVTGPEDTTGCMNANPSGNTVLVQPNEVGLLFVGSSGLYTWTAVRENGTPFLPSATGKFRVRAPSEF